ncbi:TRAP transporter substrate-binding protein [Luteimonas viscosa]|nr:TRAP transporter substrate-binding protein [Luteimonas viscosa]
MRRRRFIAAGLGVACAAGAGAMPALAAGRNGLLTATDVHVSDYPTVEAMRWIGQTLERETRGRLRIRLYHSGQLGREAEAIDMARFGAIDFARVYSGALNNAFPLTRALCLPYAFDSVAHMRRSMDGEVGRAVLDGFSGRGLVGLAIYDSGARCFYNARRPIRTPADLHGMKIRVPVSDIFIRLLRQFGANATPLSLGEVYSGMETRMIDGAENNIRSFHSSRHFEAARYWSQSEHSYAPDVLLLSRRTWDALDAGDRELLRDAARRSVAVMREAWDASEAAAREEVLAAGIEANEVDIDAFRAAAAPLLAGYRRDPRIEALYAQIRATA